VLGRGHDEEVEEPVDGADEVADEGGTDAAWLQLEVHHADPHQLLAGRLSVRSFEQREDDPDRERGKTIPKGILVQRM
jgi:hypothetical protein